MKAQHVSSGILLIIRSSNCICSLWFTYACGDRPYSSLDYGRSPHAYVNQRLQRELELLIMSGMPLEICWAFNERWNNTFCYKVASCWLFLLRKKKKAGMCRKFVLINSTFQKFGKTGPKLLLLLNKTNREWNDFASPNAVAFMRCCFNNLSKMEVTMYQWAVLFWGQILFFLNFNFKLMYF